MPMIPGPLAVLTYVAVKVAGYAVFARQLNKVAGKNVSPYKFAVAKTILGLVGGLMYIFVLVPAFGLSEMGDIALFLGALPIRLFVWSVALGVFYGFREHTSRMCIAVVAGATWSYVLDGVMWLIYQVVPGMVMPFC